MSGAHNSRRNRRLLRELTNLFQQGRVLAASADTPGRPGVRRTVSVSRTPDAAARVHVEHYDPQDWDFSLDESEHRFACLDIALEWLEIRCGVHWTLLHEPEGPSAGAG